ncbi:MAG: alpha/beta hydrolase [Propionibacteriaceae bacterium]|nr:alpha/beta hydrolase [Propionibacteriaceae bacterium]
MNMKNTSTVVLVPGFWLGGWAWDDVSEHLTRNHLASVPVTLPGLDSPNTRRDGIGLADHVEAVLDAIRAAASPVVLVAHSGAGMLASAVLDQEPDLVSRVVYVESGPVADGTIARPDLDPAAIEVPLPIWELLEAGDASLAGLDEDMLRRFQERAIPHPAGPLREPVRLHNPARNLVPTTVICCSLPSAAIREMVVGGVEMFAPLADLADVKYLDLPTGHWPMWSAPEELAEAIAEVACH